MRNARSDELIVSTKAKIKRGDLVDWPEGERDGYVFTPLNTVENAFHLRALADMAELARALHQDADAADLHRARTGRPAPRSKNFFDTGRGLYRDGEGTDHSSLHANLFPLAFGLVPAERRAHVAQWLGDRGMACSVYAAQYLLEGLFENGEADQSPGVDHRAQRPQLEAHARKRHDHHLGRLGPALQAESGLEPCLGRRSRQPAATVRFGRPAAHTRLDARGNQPKPRPAEKRRRKSSDATGAGPHSLGKWRRFQALAHVATRHERPGSASGGLR